VIKTGALHEPPRSEEQQPMGQRERKCVDHRGSARVSSAPA
jgi:hypothetical protein